MGRRALTLVRLPVSRRRPLPSCVPPACEDLYAGGAVSGAAPGSGIANWQLRDLRDAGRRTSGTEAVREFRDNRAGRRAVIDDAGEDAGGPREIGGAGSGHAYILRIAPSGFRERPRAEAPLTGGAACADGPRGHPAASPSKRVRGPCGRGPRSALAGPAPLAEAAPAPAKRAAVEKPDESTLGRIRRGYVDGKPVGKAGRPYAGTASGSIKRCINLTCNSIA